MASGRTPRWKIWLIKFTPFLFKKCPEGNYHWQGDEVCYCRENQHVVGTGPDVWHGGILLFKGEKEYISFWEHARVLADWAVADDFIRAQEAYKAHEADCPTCWTDSLCRTGDELIKEMNTRGQAYIALTNKRTEPRLKQI